MKVERRICLLSRAVFRKAPGKSWLGVSPSAESPGDLQDGDSESLARQIFQLHFTTQIAARPSCFQVKLITKAFFPSHKEGGAEPAGAPQYRTAEMLHCPGFTLPASSTGGGRVLNELHTGSNVSVGTLLLLI